VIFQLNIASEFSFPVGSYVYGVKTDGYLTETEMPPVFGKEDRIQPHFRLNVVFWPLSFGEAAFLLLLFPTRDEIPS
jgi:hypothetical protein